MTTLLIVAVFAAISLMIVFPLLRKVWEMFVFGVVLIIHAVEVLVGKGANIFFKFAMLTGIIFMILILAL